MSSTSISPDAWAVSLALDHLAGIHEQAADLQALLAALEHLPAGVEAEVLRTLHRLDTELAGPAGVAPRHLVSKSCPTVGRAGLTPTSEAGCPAAGLVPLAVFICFTFALSAAIGCLSGQAAELGEARRGQTPKAKRKKWVRSFRFLPASAILLGVFLATTGSRRGWLMALITVEVYDTIGEGVHSKPMSINPNAVQSVSDGPSSGKGGSPTYCVVELSGGATKNVKGTLVEVTEQLNQGLQSLIDNFREQMAR
jgi:hypothetical protein